MGKCTDMHALIVPCGSARARHVRRRHGDAAEGVVMVRGSMTKFAIANLCWFRLAPWRQRHVNTFLFRLGSCGEASMHACVWLVHTTLSISVKIHIYTYMCRSRRRREYMGVGICTRLYMYAYTRIQACMHACPCEYMVR